MQNSPPPSIKYLLGFQSLELMNNNIAFFMCLSITIFTIYIFYVFIFIEEGVYFYQE